MTKKLFLVLAIAASSIMLFSCKSKVTDEAITTAVNAQLATMSDLSSSTVSVVEGVVTISGVCKDESCSQKCKTALEAAKIAGVKSIDWKCTIAPPVAEAPVAAPASLTTMLDAKVMQTIKDGLKDIKGITVDYTAAKPAIVGEVTAATRMKIMQIFSMAKIVPDVTKLVTKK